MCCYPGWDEALRSAALLAAGGSGFAGRGMEFFLPGFEALLTH